MEQTFQLPKEKDFKSLRFCLDNYQASRLYIGLKAAYGGGLKVNENLENKKLDFQRDNTGLHFLIDSEEIFLFPLKTYDESKLTKGFFIEYERFEMFKGIERRISPYLERDLPSEFLPEPKNSVLRNVLDHYLIEISFKGEINLEFHSWWNEDLGWKYWKVVK